MKRNVLAALAGVFFAGGFYLVLAAVAPAYTVHFAFFLIGVAVATIIYLQTTVHRLRRVRAHPCLDGHAPRDAHNLGIDPARPGWVDFYCPRCQKKISTEPICEVTDLGILAMIEDLEDSARE